MPEGSNSNSAGVNKKEQILLAAVEMFLDRDYYQVTITDIAEQAGVGKGTVYEYFPSKEDLFKESFSHCADTYLQLFRQHLSTGVPVRQTMHDLIAAHLDLLRENRQRLYLLFNERPLSLHELQGWVIEKRREILKRITIVLKEGIATGELRPDLDVEIAGRLFLAINFDLIGGMVILDDQDVSEEKVAGLINIIWNGVVANKQVEA
ncbi:MAG: TetR/AcrR family transcriptional regulator [Bacillota bacterium]